MSEEKIKDINKEAYKQAEKELMEQQVAKVKGYILKTLEKLEEKKKDKERIEEELRILKLDLEDLRNGRFEKIEERIEKSRVAKSISAVPYTVTTAGATPHNLVYTACGLDTWVNATSGTYSVQGKIYYL